MFSIIQENELITLIIACFPLLFIIVKRPQLRVIPCALIFNEVLVNAFKYAFPDRKDGNINVSLMRRKNMFILEISDNGIGMPENLMFQKNATLGLRLIDMLSKQLEGSVSYTKDNGSHFTILFKNITG